MHISKSFAAIVSLGLGLGADLQAQITFVDRARLTNTDDHSFGRGAAMVDIDGDGLLDLIAANDNMPNFFFRQRPNHTFEDATTVWGIAFDERQHWGVLVTDFDNDGDPDVYFINGGFPGQPNQLLRNDISTSGVLTDVSAASGDGDHSVRHFGGIPAPPLRPQAPARHPRPLLPGPTRFVLRIPSAPAVIRTSLR